MCRLLAVRSEEPFAIGPYLERFAQISRDSKEYQGHGWGCAYLEDGGWRIYKDINPIWEDDLRRFPETTLLLAHARSAFQDRDIFIENNMPFYSDEHMFIFNGELRGVRLNEQGRIGAEKIFNFVRRFDKGSMLEAMQRAIPLIQKRTRYVRAMNIIVADKGHICLASLFNENPDYFTMYMRQSADGFVVCSDPFKGEHGWEKIPNNTITEL